MLITGARLVDRGEAVDIRITDGLITEVGPRLPRTDEVLDADGRWVIPGLWDHHVHLDQLGLMENWFSTAAAATPDDLVRLVAGQVAACADPTAALVGFGARPSLWAREPHRSELDAVSGDHLIVLVSGDGHSAWLNTAAQRRFGIIADGLVSEDAWFGTFARLDELSSAEAIAAGVRSVLARAQRLGIVGLTDLTLAPTFATWASRRGAVRVRAGFYAVHLDQAIDTGLRTGDRLSGLATMGPLKVISDGSLGSVTAACDAPYGPRHSVGVQNADRATLTDLARRCASAGLEVTFHAIGDRACADALDAIEAAGVRGSIEHAQLVRRTDIDRMARLGIRASVQPAHILDDIPALNAFWADRADRAYAFRSMLDAGVDVRLGSDAPVAPFDPWLAMAAAVHRNHPDGEPWHPEQRISAAAALACSTDGHPGITAGARADLVLLDADPLAPHPDTASTAAHLLSMRSAVSATIVAGVVVA